MSTQLYPEVKDATSLGARFSEPTYLPIGIEGQMDTAGTGVVLTPYTVTRPADADTIFGSASSLAAFVKFLLNRGIPSVVAVPSKKGSAPLLADRQAAWAVLEADESIRIRLTDSTVQADLVALATSCTNAEGINHKQICFVGMAAGTGQTTYLTAATAIASKRAVLIAPAVYDENGVLLSGAYAAAGVAAEVSKNGDISDDLDTFPIPGWTGIEKSATGVPVFQKRIVSGTPTNDFETLLQGGVSPLRQGRNGGAQITHLRTTYTVDSTYDALETRLIVDQLFIDVRDYVEGNNFLRRGNTQKVRDDIAAGVEALLTARNNWISPKVQSDGSTGYSVSVVASTDNRQVTVSYSGVVVRGIQTVLVDAQLQIPV